MAVIKPLKPSHQLQLFRALSARKEFSLEESQYFHSLQKGYEGEKRWQEYLKELPPEIPILYDLTLNINHTTFQIDALIIYQQHITFFEVKNYSGNFTSQDRHWYHSTDKEIKNPSIQIERNETLIRQFFKQHHLHLTFDYLLIFVNSEFMLYDATPRKNLILPPQIPSLIKKLKQISHTPTIHHTKIIQTLLSHQTEQPLFVIPDYTYHDVAKGLFCKKCNQRMERMANRNRMICTSCKTVYSFESALLNLIDEFSILFAPMRITNQVIYEWCNRIISKSTIRRVLGHHYALKGNGRGAYYEKRIKHIKANEEVDQ
ncbi:NERD domain-containing protein [Cytobacillus sp. Sa5YUA1]|uniref:NERD domain-containing protein n=1 Tax=Cytobacillus stercorigallinarum TaxID=2762240 RepID=A0ABR8QVG6_9BACI|nr:nuclease-related domain-containing protein [Cytobacillus stercorigallinarum]MBD7939525.1 NERD domain-containing protein [Cytobacillus stercorigallinarum]